jgi:hypothetical protein
MLNVGSNLSLLISSLFAVSKTIFESLLKFAFIVFHRDMFALETKKRNEIEAMYENHDAKSFASVQYHFRNDYFVVQSLDSSLFQPFSRKPATKKLFSSLFWFQSTQKSTKELKNLHL